MAKKPIVEEKKEHIPIPEEICEHLNQYVVGQEDAKRVLSVAVYNHYKRLDYLSKGGGEVEIKKSNVMMIGPTGSGKTYIIQTLCKLLGASLAMADATVLVTADNMGKAIEDVLLMLIRNSGGDPRKAEKGMVFIDEIDKLVTGVNRSKGESIQQALLKIIEGTKYELIYEGQKVILDTNNILFLVGGAFVNLASMVQMRLADTKSYLMSEAELVKLATTEDLAKFGLIPEFVGRIPVIVLLFALNKSALIDALVKPKNAVTRQFVQMFAMDGIELEFSPESLEVIAEKAIELKTGARGLRTILENAMRDLMYIIPSEKNLKKVIITADVISRGAKPEMEYLQSSVESGELTPLQVKKPRSVFANAD
jgi:ATP-dependent Clp protease ATP-binding subunit ClpX